jgi:hypothetical protein
MTWKSGITLALAGLCVAGTAAAQVPGSSMQPGGPSNPSVPSPGAPSPTVPNPPVPNQPNPARPSVPGTPPPPTYRTDSGSDSTLRPRDSGSADYRCDGSHALRDCTGSRRTASLSRDCKGASRPLRAARRAA